MVINDRVKLAETLVKNGKIKKPEDYLKILDSKLMNDSDCQKLFDETFNNENKE